MRFNQLFAVQIDEERTRRRRDEELDDSKEGKKKTLATDCSNDTVRLISSNEEHQDNDYVGTFWVSEDH